MGLWGFGALGRTHYPILSVRQSTPCIGVVFRSFGNGFHFSVSSECCGVPQIHIAVEVLFAHLVEPLCVSGSPGKIPRRWCAPSRGHIRPRCVLRSHGRTRAYPDTKCGRRYRPSPRHVLLKPCRVSLSVDSTTPALIRFVSFTPATIALPATPR